MSAYRNYTSWNKNAGSTYSGSTGTKSESVSSKYEPAYSTHLTDSKRTGETASSSRLGQKYGGSASYQVPASSAKDAGRTASINVTARFKDAIEKKDTLYPPVSYRPITSRSGTRSRDPSAERESVERSSSSLGTSSYTRPNLYSRSTSREQLDCIPTTLTSTIPKYTGRLSSSKESRSALGQNSKKDDTSIASKFKTDRLDVDSGSKKYITSRFLPKNTIEKSHTAYLRPTSTRIASSQRETSRKNKEILNLLHAQNESNKITRSPSRCSSVSGDISNYDKKDNTESFESVSVESGTPSTQTKSSSFQDKRNESSAASSDKQTNKMFSKTTERNEPQHDKLKTKTAAPTPWNSYLDLKFSSPGNNKSNTCHHGKSQSSGSNSPKSLSRNNSTKSLNQSSAKSDVKSKSASASLSLSSKQLPPPVPSNIKGNLPIPNKDFRKSVLNMNTGKNSQKCHRSSSVSSADSEGENQLSEATDISENLSSCKSFHKNSCSSISRLPVKGSSDYELSRRSNTPSECNSSSTAATSGSEDDSKSRVSSKIQSGSSKPKGIPRIALTISTDDSSKPPMSPRIKVDAPKSEADAKSFLVKTLGPVTGFFKFKHHESNEKVNWMDSSSDNVSEANKVQEDQASFVKLDVRSNSSQSDKSKLPRKFIRRVESGERPWWQDENAEVPEGIQVYTEPQTASYNKIHFRRVESGEKPWWQDANAERPEGIEVIDTPPKQQSQENIMSSEYSEKHQIRHIDSGERAWWLGSSESIPENVTKEKNIYSSENKKWWIGAKQDSQETSCSDSEDHFVPLGDRASPEGLEMPKESESRPTSTYDNLPIASKAKRPDTLFISRHKNIDDILGGASQSLSPLMDRLFVCQGSNQLNKTDIKVAKNSLGMVTNNMDKLSISENLDDASLQLYKDGDYGSYLDLEASISEQQEEFEGFQSNKKNSIVLRTQLSVRVHTIIEKLLTSEGRELRRALFSLKQIFQEDKDLVHEFVQNDGLACLIKVGSVADQNYQNYILRALGQVMLYVDGMNGVIQHNETVQWLYSLISSKFRLVVKTALKLLLVFVEYVDTNCLLLIKAVQVVDGVQGFSAWFNIMKLLKDFDSADTELLIYAMTLINKCFNGIPDQDTYYDQTDSLEEQGIEGIIQRYMSKPGTDLDLLQQFQIYEAVLQYEDGEEKTLPLRHLEESIRKTLRNRKSLVASAERRKSRRHSTGNSPLHSSLGMRKAMDLYSNAEDEESSSSQSSAGPNDVHLNGSYKENNKANDAGVTPALRRRRERAERQLCFMREQQESASLFRESANKNEGNYTNSLQQRISNGSILNRTPSRKDLTPLLNAVNKLDSDDSSLTKQPWILSMMYNGKNIDDHDLENIEDDNENERKVLLHLKRENTVKDLTQKLANQNVLQSPSEDNKVNRIGDMSGLISKAKEGLAKSKSKVDVLKSPTSESIPKTEAKKSENELRWEELVNSLSRPLHLCDLDFTDLGSEDEIDVLAPTISNDGIPPPPPPPPMGDVIAPPPPPINTKVPPPVPNAPIFGSALHRITKPVESKIPIKKNKKTVKLFWKEVRDDPIINKKIKTGSIWDELSPVSVDTQKLEHLFESRAKDLITKEKQQELNKNKEIIVLDPKRSNAINIGMTKLPPPRSIKTAILKMDATIMNREGIEKLLTMLPTEEERSKIQEAQASNPDLPLGSAEQFLLTLASISELPARLNLWAFKLDFENLEREIAEPLMDLKQGFEVLRINKTFRAILGTLLSIGIFLNGAEVKGFQIDYLSKVPEVKDTVHKHSLLHHLCHIVMEKFPDATDLYSEIGAITRASKIDFDELTLNIQRLETDCKASWDHLKLIAKHDGSTMMKVKMSDFLADCAERIILLGIIHRRVMNRFHRFLLWLGIPLHQISDTKPNEFCRVISEFALEYRTTRERVLQQLEKKANHRERNKTRGKMITEIGKFRTNEDRADAELRQLLGSDMSDVESLQGTLPWRRRSRDTNRSFLCQANGNLTDGDDEILESLVKTATKGPSRTAPRERKRTRHADRKSLKRSRTRENNPFASRDSP